MAIPDHFFISLPDNLAPSMRRTIRLDYEAPINFSALHAYERFLFRNVDDEQRWALGVGELAVVKKPKFKADNTVHDWVFGFLNYDLKNHLEPLHSHLGDELGYPKSHWFVPQFVFERNEKGLWLHVHETDEIQGIVLAASLFSNPRTTQDPIYAPFVEQWTPRTSHANYLNAVGTLLDHIHRGDIYEVNYCTSRHAEVDENWDPFQAFSKLFENTNAAHAGFLRMGDRFALCASPERFLSFKRNKVMAQPMKGTRPCTGNKVTDQHVAKELANDPKERAENIMALDVMRNDLSKIAASRSVVVTDLCGVHIHGQVLQMTSTVTAELRPGIDPFDAVIASFPMASMTGAPKFRAMQLIDAIEEQNRGLFSGTLGFFAPDGSADLNVIIRTLFFDRTKNVATIVTGGALTALCDPQQEWEECELKARSVINALQ